MNLNDTRLYLATLWRPATPIVTTTFMGKPLYNKIAVGFPVIQWTKEETALMSTHSQAVIISAN